MLTDQSHIGPERVRLEIQARFNPIRGLTPQLLATHLDSFHVGMLRSAALIWDAMERRDLMLRNVALKRKKSVARYGWDILTVDDSPDAKAQAQTLRQFYNSISVTSVLDQDERGGFSLLVRQMMDAIGKHYAVHEIVWTPSSTGALSAQFRFVPLWFFEARTGKLRFLKQQFGIEGVDMEENGWLVTVADGLMEATSVGYIFKHMPLNAWLGFCDKFGFPGLLGKTEAARDSDQWNAMVEAVKAFANDWAAVCNHSDAIELIEAKGQGQLPFEPLVEFVDRAIAALWRGADLSTMSQGQPGVGASVQSEESDILLEDDSQLISETLNLSVDRYVITYTHGEVPAKAYIKIRTPQKTNVDQDLKVDTFLRDSGVGLSKSDALERYGRTPAKSGEDVLTCAAAPLPVDIANDITDTATPKMLVAAADQLAAAQSSVLLPIAERLQTLVEIDNAELFQHGLEKLRRDLNDAKSPLIQSVLADPSTAQIFEKALGAGFINGFTISELHSK